MIDAMKNIDRIHSSRQPRRPHHIEDWMYRFFKNRSDDEKTRAVAMLEAAFPAKKIA